MELLNEPGGVDEQDYAKMRAEGILRDARIVDESRLHHVPPHRALQSAQREYSRQLPRQRTSDSSAHREPQQRQEEGRADQPPQKAVHGFPPEDPLEPGEIHSRIDLAEFG